MRIRFATIVAAAALGSLLTATGPVRADDSQLNSPPIPPDQQGVAPSGAKFFTGSGLGRTGDFLGKMVDLSCNMNPPAGTKTQCNSTDHYYALQVDGQPGLHPLLAGDDKIL